MPKYYGCPCEGCGRPLALTDDIVVCPDCGAPYHRECYEKLGRCIHTPAHGAGYEWTFPYKDDALRTCPSCGERTLRTEERCRCCGAVLPPESQCPEPPTQSQPGTDADGRFDYNDLYRQYQQTVEEPTRRNVQAAFGKEELIDGSVLYLRIYFLGMPALAVYNCGNAIFSADGDTARPVRYLLLAGVLNVIMNLFFVVICKMDVAGVATASAISQYVSAGLILRDLFCINTDYRLHLSKLRPDPSKTIDILKIGIPSGLQNAIFALANLFVQVGVNSFSATMVAGNSAAANSDGLIYDVMAAIYTACASFMSQNLGAGKRDRVLKSYLISLLYSFGIGGAMGLLLVIFGKQFLSLFTADPEVITAGLKRLTIMGFSYGVSAFMDCTIAASRALGKSLVPMFIVIMGSCVFRVVWVYTVFAYFKTIPSLYLLYVFSWTITAIAEIIYFLHVYRGIFPKANAVA